MQKAVALITGGAQGLGKEFSKVLLARGARVVIADINEKNGHLFEQECLEQYGEEKLKFVKCDVTNQQELNNAFETAKERFGSLDIVCNNAGIMKIDPEKARTQVAVNLTATIEGTYKAIDMMSVKNGGNGGVIINIASAAGVYLMQGAAVYSASKFGVVAFTRAFEYLPHLKEDRIRVNCLCPIICDTEMVRQVNRESPDLAQTLAHVGMVEASDITKAFMQCVDDENMNAAAVLITRPHKIHQLSFPHPVPKL